MKKSNESRNEPSEMNRLRVLGVYHAASAGVSTTVVAESSTNKRHTLSLWRFPKNCIKSGHYRSTNFLSKSSLFPLHNTIWSYVGSTTTNSLWKKLPLSRQGKREKERDQPPIPTERRRVQAAKEKGTWSNIISRGWTCAGDGKLFVRASATIRWVQRGTSLSTPAHHVMDKVTAGINTCGETLRTCAEQDFRTWQHTRDYPRRSL